MASQGAARPIWIGSRRLEAQAVLRSSGRVHSSAACRQEAGRAGNAAACGQAAYLSSGLRAPRVQGGEAHEPLSPLAAGEKENSFVKV